MKLLRALLSVAIACGRLSADRCDAAEGGNAQRLPRPQMQTSPWGPEEHGLQCRVIAPVELEQGMPIIAFVELRNDPKKLKPGVRSLNTFLPETFLSLRLTNREDRTYFTIQPFDPGAGMPAFDEGKTTVPLQDAARSLRWKITFPLIKLYEVLPPGTYDCGVRYSFPMNRTRWWHADGEAAWEKAGFWNGTVYSGHFVLNVLRETPVVKTFLLPKRLRLVKESVKIQEERDAPRVAVPFVRFKREDAEAISLPVRNGHFLGTKVHYSDGMAQFGGPPKPDDVNPVSAWYDYKAGDRSIGYHFELFETADPPRHGWMASPGSGGYRLLWARSFEVTLTDSEFQKQPVTALDLSKSEVRDAGLTILDKNPFLERLSLANNRISDAGLTHLAGLGHLQSLHLYDTDVTDAGLVHLRHVPELRILILAGTKLTDAGIAQLKDFSELQSLDLARTQVTDAALEHLKAMTNLTFLSLYDTKVADAGLIHLRGLTNLEMLFLSGTPVSDAGLAHLKALTSLKSLRLDRTKVSDHGVDDLRLALPDCWIER